MKKILFLLSILTLLFSCNNQKIEFPDFAYQTIYFPFQTPLRTIMLGDEVEGDNSIDLEHAFSVGVSLGGMYQNNKNRVVSVQFAPELASKITDGSGNVLQLLPAQYYNATIDKITIPAGSFFGKLKVNLTDAFFTDSLTTGLRYVLPLRITDAEGDSILSGKPAAGVVSPDPRNPNDWITPPMNYVLFGIKYINPTHGVYLLRGKRVNTTNALDVVTYSTRFVTGNDMTSLTTKSLTKNYMSTVGGTNKESANARYSMLLTFNNSTKSVIISQRSATTVVVNGTGMFYDKADPQAEGYNGEKHRTIYLDYTYVDAGKTYHTNDSLVFVDTNMKFETFSVLIKP